MSAIRQEPRSNDAPAGGALLRVRDLSVAFTTPHGGVLAVDRVSFDLAAGRTLCVVGESGSGKTAMSMALLGLHEGNARVSGEAWLGDVELLSADKRCLSEVRGTRIAMVFQDALSALHPYFPVGSQVVEGWRRRSGASRAEARTYAVELLSRVGIPRAQERVANYPHEFSGGMRQRAMIAMALANEPEVIIADEPTTALDVTVQAQMLELLRDIQRERGMSLLFVTHDLAVVAELADEVMVMYGGRKVEAGARDAVFAAPAHPYTVALMDSVPRLDRPVERLSAIPGSPPLLSARLQGCPFSPRCSRAPELGDVCSRTSPPRRERTPGHNALCHLPETGRILEEAADDSR
ncbi:MAG: ABC transporter ATP-binding protein [Conexibacter sp.]